MNKGLHNLFIACLFAFLGCISLAELKAQTTPVLKHSYTFEDGAAKDVVGTADGTLEGGTITDGVYTTSANGQHIILPHETIKINEYSSITMEAYITSPNGANNTPTNKFTMLAYFGGSQNNMGYNGYFMSVARGDDVARTAISTGTEVAPYNSEDGVSTAANGELEDGLKHHLVSILTNDSIVWYIDGERIGRADIREGRTISQLGNEYAFLAKGGYLNDPTWLGSIHEFNLYEGVMEASTIENRAEAFLADTEPTLSAITVTVGEETYPLNAAFSPNVTEYTVKVPNGTTTATVTATPTYESSEVVGDGALTLVDGAVTTEILVTSSKNETMTYTLTIEELSNDATLTDITAKVGEEVMVLSPAFDPTVEAYTISVPFGTTSFNVGVTSSHPAATPEGTGNIDIIDGKGIAEITVTAEDGETKKTYKVTAMVEGLEGNADLQILNFKQGNLSPAFDPEITEYALVLNQKEDFVNVFAKTAVKDAILEGEAADMTYVELNEDGTATATFTVTSMNGKVTKIYTVNISTDPQAPTSIGDDINSPLKVYPTFSKGEFTVEFGSATGKVTVYDLSGKLILEKATSTSKTTVNVQEAGMYIFHLETKGLSRKIKAFKVN